jgi:hypothetical protein
MTTANFSLLERRAGYNNEGMGEAEFVLFAKGMKLHAVVSRASNLEFC